MSAPLVALTATTKMIDGLPRVRLNEAYVNAVRAAGMTPLIVPPLEPRELEPILDAVKGLVLTGGEDIDPAEYGEARHPEVQSVHTRRDKSELHLARLAREHKLPTLAICRGIQVVNVAFGGTLVQDIPSQRPSNIDHDQSEKRDHRLHNVRIEPKSRLARALEATVATVNTSHHQSVDRVAPGMNITARAEDGIIEGMESSDDDWWMLAVQWHPEELINDDKPWDRGLFRAFANRLTR
jgi:putative glutamine amidotransferase